MNWTFLPELNDGVNLYYLNVLDLCRFYYCNLQPHVKIWSHWQLATSASYAAMHTHFNVSFIWPVILRYCDCLPSWSSGLIWEHHDSPLPESPPLMHPGPCQMCIPVGFILDWAMVWNVSSHLIVVAETGWSRVHKVTCAVGNTDVNLSQICILRMMASWRLVILGCPGWGRSRICPVREILILGITSA